MQLFLIERRTWKTRTGIPFALALAQFSSSRGPLVQFSSSRASALYQASAIYIFKIFFIHLTHLPYFTITILQASLNHQGCQI
jgi:hypothetical protein